MTTIRHKTVVGLAALAAGLGLVSVAAPAGAVAPAGPVIHRCDVNHITPTSHLFVRLQTGDEGLCFTGQGTTTDVQNLTPFEAISLKPADGKIMQVTVTYVCTHGYLREYRSGHL
ncbi:hypothetical protein ACIBJF_42490 [Streptomyces sp. NPDC050743]|uniref:hypothetical protein n=1 Tax=Streptomyces sp. NPDC050743 TaxID=3365634 RepID=UPI0037980497